MRRARSTAARIASRAAARTAVRTVAATLILAAATGCMSVGPSDDADAKPGGPRTAPAGHEEARRDDGLAGAARHRDGRWRAESPDERGGRDGAGGTDGESGGDRTAGADSGRGHAGPPGADGTGGDTAGAAGQPRRGADGTHWSAGGMGGAVSGGGFPVELPDSWPTAGTGTASTGTVGGWDLPAPSPPDDPPVPTGGEPAEPTGLPGEDSD